MKPLFCCEPYSWVKLSDVMFHVVPARGLTSDMGKARFARAVREGGRKAELAFRKTRLEILRREKALRRSAGGMPRVAKRREK